MRGWKSPTRMHFKFVRCANSHNLYCAQGVPQGSSLKLKKEVDFWGCSWLLPPSLPSSRTWPSLSGCHVLVFCWWSAPPPPSVLVRYNICTMLDHRHLGLCIWAMSMWHLYSLINILIENTTQQRGDVDPMLFWRWALRLWEAESWYIIVARRLCGCSLYNVWSIYLHYSE